MLEFIQRLNDVSRKPVGIKVCIGSNRGVNELINAIRRTAIVPSFITVDGREGGTGSGAYELQQYAGLPAARALPLLTTALLESGFRQNTRLFVAARISSGYDLARPTGGRTRQMPAGELPGRCAGQACTSAAAVNLKKKLSHFSHGWMDSLLLAYSPNTYAHSLQSLKGWTWVTRGNDVSGVSDRLG